MYSKFLFLFCLLNYQLRLVVLPLKIMFIFNQKNYDQFDGFVILHGTDTMAYTASALSFMLEDLGKPVVLTGAQVSLILNTYLIINFKCYCPYIFH